MINTEVGGVCLGFKGSMFRVYVGDPKDLPEWGKQPCGRTENLTYRSLVNSNRVLKYLMLKLYKYYERIVLAGNASGFYI